MTPRVRLIIATALFVGWLGWLGFTALTKSRAPVVSRAQAAGATVPVVVELTTGEDGREVFLLRQHQPFPTPHKEKADRPAIVAAVVESFNDGPEKGIQIAVTDLPNCTGYTGPGQYLLLLNKVEGAYVAAPGATHTAYTLAGQQRSPGSDLIGGPWVIYPWSEKTADDLRKQVKKLFP